MLSFVKKLLENYEIIKYIRFFCVIVLHNTPFLVTMSYSFLYMVALGKLFMQIRHLNDGSMVKR